MRTVAVALAAVVLLAGCGGHDPKPKAGTTARASASPTQMLTPTAPADTPLGAGQRAWAAFSERGLSRDAWWAQLHPLLSEAAAAVYKYTDPSRIPAMKLTGDLTQADKAPDDPKFTAEVIVPTSRGQFLLDLERRSPKAPWLLYAITFPQGVQ